MNLLELAIQVENLRNGEKADVDSINYLSQVLMSGDSADSRALLSSVIERDISNDEWEQFKLCNINIMGVFQKEKLDNGIELLTDQQKSKLRELEIDVIIENNLKTIPTTKKEQAKEKKKKPQQIEQLEPIKILPKDLVGEGEFHTKRFERFHKNWMGQSQWKHQEHSMNDTVEELDDDDYSSAWLECLRLGIPWGGRGAGGRGVHRVTGEQLDVNIFNVTMARNGVVLLKEATLKLMYGRRYCLTGRNGCGKSTLLRRIATGSLPGWPPWLRVQLMTPSRNWMIHKDYISN